MRLLEAETAYDLGITYGEEWYNIPVMTREYMIATSLARKWLEVLMAEEAHRESNARSR